MVKLVVVLQFCVTAIITMGTMSTITIADEIFFVCVALSV